MFWLSVGEFYRKRDFSRDVSKEIINFKLQGPKKHKPDTFCFFNHCIIENPTFYIAKKFKHTVRSIVELESMLLSRKLHPRERR